MLELTVKSIDKNGDIIPSDDNCYFVYLSSLSACAKFIEYCKTNSIKYVKDDEVQHENYLITIQL